MTLPTRLQSLTRQVSHGTTTFPTLPTFFKELFLSPYVMPVVRQTIWPVLFELLLMGEYDFLPIHGSPFSHSLHPVHQFQTMPFIHVRSPLYLVVSQIHTTLKYFLYLPDIHGKFQVTFELSSGPFPLTGPPN